jgi:phytoene dehydrogenase-like protein
MSYDVIIIGAGMSGLAAGIRLAYFGKRVCILERHYAFGGLNSYYRLNGRDYDVGLHAVTNYASSSHRNAPLPKLLRQLRLRAEDFDLQPQRFSLIDFPQTRLRFSNDPELLVSEVAERFPSEADRFRQLLADIQAYDDARLDGPRLSTRSILRDVLGNSDLIEMLLCPIMYYGSAEEHDMDFTQFVILFKSIFLEGFGRPREGVRRIVRALVRKYRGCGGELRMRCGVMKIQVDHGRAVGVILDSGEQISAGTIMSSAGYPETLQLCGGLVPAPADLVGRLSFVEAIAVLDRPPAALGHEATIVFFNDASRFTYAAPDDLVDFRSGVLCCPANYLGHDDLPDPCVRLTWLAGYDRWSALAPDDYAAAKKRLLGDFAVRARHYVQDFEDHVVCTDLFTPVTIRRYTGHLGGAVYGSPVKRRDGRTPVENLFICGTDQGYLGITGAMLSGITMANIHVLQRD